MMKVARPNGFAAFAAVAFFALALAAFAASAVAEDSPLPAAQPAPQPSAQSAPPGAQPIPPQPPPATKPGFLHKLKGWWDDSITFFDRGVKGTRGAFEDIGKKSGDTAKDAASIAGDAMKKTIDVSKDDATAIEKLPNTRVISVHELCEKAPNGAPDCETAAAKGCRSKGFSGGHPIDVRSAENCDLASLQAGKRPVHDQCPVDTVVTRAICQ